MSSPSEYLSSVEVPPSSSILPPTTQPSSKALRTDFRAPPPQMKGQHVTVSNDFPRDNSCGYQKRSLTFSLPSDEPSRPSKRAKKIMTTVSTKRDREVDDLHNLRVLQLARASREAFAAQVRLRLRRIQELDVMRTIAYDEYEEALSLLRQADRQVGEVRHTISSAGTSIATLSSLRLSPVPSTFSTSSLDGVSNDGSASASPSPPNV
ncbi:hypothetical protein EDD15DRAFT_2367995 [Pisolithus albus]|nr:hypothetical protein EDD15DRAFT_2367995 [Pisolithus albus]